jgi:hypothetical protein
MPEPIELNFRYTEAEYTAAARFFYARTIHTSFNLIISIIAIISGLAGVLLAGDSIVWFLLIFAGVILLLMSFHAHFVTPRLHYRRNPKFREQYHLQFSEDGLLFRSKDVESRLEWSFYSKVWETPQFYFLLYGKDMFTLIPKRVFTSREQEATFRNILKLKIDSGVETYNLADKNGAELEGQYVPPRSPPDWR